MTRREFPPKVRLAAFQRANGHCEDCRARLAPGRFAYDHIVPDALGGEPTLDNCMVLCRDGSVAPR
jgi:5-methylcytosine-specific restriction protein A